MFQKGKEREETGINSQLDAFPLPTPEGQPQLSTAQHLFVCSRTSRAPCQAVGLPGVFLPLSTLERPGVTLGSPRMEGIVDPAWLLEHLVQDGRLLLPSVPARREEHHMQMTVATPHPHGKPGGMPS